MVTNDFLKLNGVSPADQPAGGFRGGPCPLCQRASPRFLYRSKDYNHNIPGSFNYVQCTHCGLVYENPRPVPAQVMAIYPESYGNPNAAGREDLRSAIDSPVNYHRSAVVETYRNGGSLFDIGCGGGFFMSHMEQRGWRVCGMDPSVEHVHFAVNRMGLKSVSQGQWPVDCGQALSVHVVTLFHVIEHLLDPVGSIRKTWDILEPGGLLVVETPNIESWPASIFKKRWVTLDAPRHISIFSPDTLRRCAILAGYDILELRTFSPSVMEYTESFRYLLSDIGLRDYRRKNEGRDRPGTGALCWKPSRRISLKEWLHMMEARFFRIVNKWADRFGYGCNLLLVAQKKSSQE